VAVDGFRVLAEYLASAKRALKPLRVREAELHAAARPRQILIIIIMFIAQTDYRIIYLTNVRKKLSFWRPRDIT
jgi:hypothetical protein